MRGKPNFGGIVGLMAAPALLAAIVASYTAFWFYNADQMKEHLAAWAAERQALGDEAEYVVAGTSGFPMRVVLEVSAARVAFHRGESTWSLAAPKLELVSRVFSPRAISIELPDGTEVRRTRADRADVLRKSGGVARLDFRVDSAEALRTARFGVDGLVLGGSWNGTAMTSPMRIGHGTLDVAVEPALATAKNEAAPTARIDLEARDLRWPDTVAVPLGPEVASIDFEADITGPIKAGPLHDALADWRAAGGTVAVKRVGLHWGKSSLDGTGTLVLDKRLQPTVSLAARVEGFVPLVDVLDTAGLIRDSDATLARLVLGREMPASGPANLSLSLRDGVVYAGPLALVRVPDVTWPGAPAAPPSAGLLQPNIDIGKDGKVRRKGDPL